MAWGLVKLASVQPGNLVVDPMAGMGGCVLQCLEQHPLASVLGFDVSEHQVDMLRHNVAACSTEEDIAQRAGVGQADARHLPLRGICVDRFIVDLPFGLNEWHHRAGKAGSLSNLYTEVIREMARCAAEGAVAAVLCAKAGLVKQAAAASKPPLWAVTECRAVRLVQLHCAVLVLRRTREPWRPGGS